MSISLKNSVVRVERAGLPRPRRREQLDHAAAGDAASASSHASGRLVARITTSAGSAAFVAPNALRQRQPLGPRLGDRHVRAARQRGLDDQQPHLAAADHEQPRPGGHARAVQAAHAAGERLDQRRRLVADRCPGARAGRAPRWRPGRGSAPRARRARSGSLERLAQRLAAARAVLARRRTARGDGRTRACRARAGPGPTPRRRPPARGRARAARAGATYHSIRSLPQIPHARIATSTSPGPGSGAGRSSIRTSPSPR